MVRISEVVNESVFAIHVYQILKLFPPHLLHMLLQTLTPLDIKGA